MKDWRYEKVINSAPLSDNGTNTFRMPGEGVMNNLSLYIYSQNDNAKQNEPIQRLTSYLTNVTIIGDDDDIIVDASAEQLRALFWDGNGQCPQEKMHSYGNKGQWTTIPICFGRYERDEKFGLDLSKWTEVEVKITNTFAAATQTANTGEVTGRALWEKGGEIKPDKFLSAVEIDKHVCARANERYPKKIAKQFPVRRLQIQATWDVDSVTGCPLSTFNNAVNNIKFTKNTREDVIWNDTLRELGRYNTKEYGADMECVQVQGVGTMMYPDVCLAYPVAITEMAQGDAGAAAVAGSLMADDQERYPQVRAYAASDFAMWHIYGSSPYGTGTFRFYSMKPYLESMDNESEWLNPQLEADVELEFYLQDVDATVHVLTEASKPHPT